MHRHTLKLMVLFLSLFLLRPEAAFASQHGEQGHASNLGSPLNAEGLHIESWYKQTTGDLSGDMRAAIAEGKTLAIIWEQPGCEYCLRMHTVNFKVEKTVKLITDNFYVVRFNMRGDKPVTDFDGTAMTESSLASAHRITGTPTVEFRDPQMKEVFRMPGYAPDPLFSAVFQYVATNGYEQASLETWYRENILNANQGGG